MSQTPALRPIIRPLEPLDVDGVCEIEAASGPAAWTRKELVRVVRLPGSISRVLTEPGNPTAIIGFFVLTHELDELYIANLAVAPAWRRQGLATRALEAIVEIADSQGLGKVLLDVQEENLGAQICYKKAGFRAVEILPRKYPGTFGRQDGYRMQRWVASAVSIPG